VTPQKDKIFVVIAAFNEARVIGTVAAQVRRLGYSTAVVDDGSKDGIPFEALGAGAVVIEHPFNLGQGRRTSNWNRLCAAEWSGGHRHLRCRRTAQRS
jgi:glycosyltransferase involved in cell wall biosynthesis